MHITVTSGQKEAFDRAAKLLRRQAQGLQETGSEKTVAAIMRYVATLEKVASAPGTVDLTPEEKVQLEQSSFLLEGIRDSLLNADFRDRANVIQGDVDALGSVVVHYNTAASKG